jgi:hypothetical protein
MRRVKERKSDLSQNISNVERALVNPPPPFSPIQRRRINQLVFRSMPNRTFVDIFCDSSEIACLQTYLTQKEL